MTGRAREPADFSQTQPPDDEWLATAEPELPIDPDLPIIDTHTHLWHRGNGHRYFVEQLGRDISDSGHNVIATVYVECNSMYRAHGPSHLRPVGETEFAAGQAAIALSGRYGAAEIASAIVGFADLTLGDELPAILDAHIAAANGRLRGIRMRAKWDPDPVVKGANSAAGPGLYITPEFQRGLRQVAKRGLIFEASIFHPQIADVTALARAVPEAEIVLIHTGSPVGHGSYRGAEAGVHADWLRDMTELARCPNVSVKLGGMLMSLASYDFGLAERPINSAELAALWRPFFFRRWICSARIAAWRLRIFRLIAPASPMGPIGTCSSGSAAAAARRKRPGFFPARPRASTRCRRAVMAAGHDSAAARS